MAYKGRYKVINKSKYKGNPSNIIYRSSWERNFMVYCDTTDSILKWSSEEISIPYRSPIDRKVHKYYPDFFVEILNTQKKKQRILIEVKPKKQTQPPKISKTKTARYLKEVKTWGINSAKWEAAVSFCKQKKWQFMILTEDQLTSKYKTK